MASNQGGGNRSGGQGGRGFASMDQEQQRRIAQKGGEASARSQKRDEDGQFAGSKGGNGSRGSSGRSSGGNSGGSRNQGGGSNR